MASLGSHWLDVIGICGWRISGGNAQTPTQFFSVMYWLPATLGKRLGLIMMIQRCRRT